jgi:hypothetical protein
MDEKTGDVYFQAAKLNAHDRQVYVARKNGKVERLTDAAGSNSAYFSGDYRYFVNTWSSYSHPYVFTVRSNKGKLIKTLEDNKKLLEKTRKYNWGKRETFSFTTSEGVKLDGWMVKPVDFVARALAVQDFLQLSHLGHLLAVNLGNHVTFLQSCISTVAVFINLGNRTSRPQSAVYMSLQLPDGTA